jgi:hypothetical protein
VACLPDDLSQLDRLTTPPGPEARHTLSRDISSTAISEPAAMLTELLLSVQLQH